MGGTDNMPMLPSPALATDAGCAEDGASLVTNTRNILGTIETTPNWPQLPRQGRAVSSGATDGPYLQAGRSRGRRDQAASPDSRPSTSAGSASRVIGSSPRSVPQVRRIGLLA